MFTHLRIARPVTTLQRSVAMYIHGLELRILGDFVDPDGYRVVVENDSWPVLKNSSTR